MSNTYLYIIIIIALLYALTASNNNKLHNPSCQSHRYERMSDNTDITVYWFHRPGCPHCDNMKSDWDKLTNSGLPKKYKLIGVDTSRDENKKLASDNNVDGVPHIVKKLPNGYSKLYNGDRSMSDMRKWILME